MALHMALIRRENRLIQARRGFPAGPARVEPLDPVTRLRPVVQPSRIPTGVTVDAVDWLPSGARSGLVRVRGHRPEGEAVDLPALVLDRGGSLQRFNSLPDPRGARDPGAWRGAYVVDATLAATADTWALEWPGGARTVLQRPEDLRASVAVEAAEAGGDVVDRGVLAERRARRAEAAEQAQARI